MTLIELYKEVEKAVDVVRFSIATQPTLAHFIAKMKELKFQIESKEYGFMEVMDLLVYKNEITTANLAPIRGLSSIKFKLFFSPDTLPDLEDMDNVSVNVSLQLDVQDSKAKQLKMDIPRVANGNPYKYAVESREDKISIIVHPDHKADHPFSNMEITYEYNIFQNLCKLEVAIREWDPSKMNKKFVLAGNISSTLDNVENVADDRAVRDCAEYLLRIVEETNELRKERGNSSPTITDGPIGEINKKIKFNIKSVLFYANRIAVFINKDESGCAAPENISHKALLELRHNKLIGAHTIYTLANI